MSISGFCKEFRKTFVLHAVAAHFNNGLLPSALLFLMLTLLTGDAYFEHTVMHLALIAICMLPVSFISGIRDWRTKYNAARAPIFYRKIWLAGILFLLVAAAVGLRLANPLLLVTGGVCRLLYIGCLSAALPLVVLLGHYGGKLAYQWNNIQR